MIKMLERQNWDSKTIYTADRGYECYKLMAQIQERHQYYVFRVKSVSSNGILFGFIIRQQDTVDNGEIAAVLIDGEATLKHLSTVSSTACCWWPRTTITHPLPRRRMCASLVRPLPSSAPSEHKKSSRRSSCYRIRSVYLSFSVASSFSRMVMVCFFSSTTFMISRLLPSSFPVPSFIFC